MTEYDFDLYVIGAGSGGVRAARISASFGAKVGIAEERYLGGTCVNVGCIPKKLLVYASEFNDYFEDAAGFGWIVGERTVDWKKLIANKDKEINRLNGVYRNLLEGAGAEIIEGTARLTDAHTIEVDGKSYTSEYILVATGGWPYFPQTPGIERAITSNEAFYLDELPQRTIIVGGGYIAVEFAGIFNGLGVDTTQVYRGPLFLRGFDEDTRTMEPYPQLGAALKRTALDNGLILSSDLGRETIVVGGKPVRERYLAAVDVLAKMHGEAWPENVIEGS